jgi:hypothetical protein
MMPSLNELPASRLLAKQCQRREKPTIDKSLQTPVRKLICDRDQKGYERQLHAWYFALEQCVE